MNYYLREITRIKDLCYRNKNQVNFVIAVKTYIDQNYADNLTLENLSATQYMSKYHLQRLFRKYYGQTPKQYLMSIRITKSKRLLQEGGKVADVCYQVGFHSPGSFSTLFKQRTGLTPADWKRATFKKKVSVLG